RVVAGDRVVKAGERRGGDGAAGADVAGSAASVIGAAGLARADRTAGDGERQRVGATVGVGDADRHRARPDVRRQRRVHLRAVGRHAEARPTGDRVIGAALVDVDGDAGPVEVGAVDRDDVARVDRVVAGDGVV